MVAVKKGRTGFTVAVIFIHVPPSLNTGRSPSGHGQDSSLMLLERPDPFRWGPQPESDEIIRFESGPHT